MRPVARGFVGLFVAVLAGACATARPDRSAATSTQPSEVGAKCGGCHTTQSTEWDESMHRASFSSPDFQASYREEPLPFCVGCHAPRKADLGMAEGAARGIDCASCHPRADEHDRAARVSHTAARDTAPHEVRDCAACHELTSPGSGTFLQSTASEHRASHARDLPCVSCHMQQERGNHDHRFRVSRDAGFLSRAIALRDVRREPEGVVLSLASVGVGHCYPTGDIFRELFVRAWIETEDGHVLGDVEVALHRDWDAHRRAFGMEHAPREVGDTRLCNEDRIVRIPGSMPPLRVPLVVRVAVDYRRGFEARGGNLAVFESLRIADWQRSLPANP
jgi:hypothetical protein